MGIEVSYVSSKEKLISGLGGFIAIFLILVVSIQFTSLADSALIVASMGASAVLLYAVPHGQLSQPWSVAGGHMISALIGVSCVKLIPDPLVAAAAAVGLAITAMHYLKCIHPPGGATALSAVIGGTSIHALGYWYVLTPVMINTLIILLVAVIFNYPFLWRRYPAYLRVMKRRQGQIDHEVMPSIPHEDFVYALSEIDSIVDITEHELLRIYDLAIKKSQQTALQPGDILLGKYYSNGGYGEEWSVRQIIDKAVEGNNDLLIYKTVAGRNRHQTGVVSQTDFLRWAKYKVYRDEGNWKRRT